MNTEYKLLIVEIQKLYSQGISPATSKKEQESF